MKAISAARVRARRMPAFARGCGEIVTLTVSSACAFALSLSLSLAISLGRRAAPEPRGRGCSASADLRRRGPRRQSGCPSDPPRNRRARRGRARSAAGRRGAVSSTRTSRPERQLPLVGDPHAAAGDVERGRLTADVLVDAAHASPRGGVAMRTNSRRWMRSTSPLSEIVSEPAFCAVSTPPKRWMPRPDMTSTASSCPTRRLMRSSMTASATVTLAASLRRSWPAASRCGRCGRSTFWPGTSAGTAVFDITAAAAGRARPGRRGRRRRASRRRTRAARRSAPARAARPGARSRRCA